MNKKFWIKFESVKPLNAIKMKREIQEKIHEATQSMEWSEKLQYFRGISKKTCPAKP
jgi:hypothetical protein